jgi:hypothetical protein
MLIHMINDLFVCVQFEVINELVLNFEVGFVGLISVPNGEKVFVVLLMPT